MRKQPSPTILGQLLVLFCLLAASASAEQPKRIVTMAANITEVIYALGAGDQVVGVGDFCFFPEEINKLPRCGGWSNPNYEQLLALKPELILVTGKFDKLVEFGRKRGIPVESVTMTSLQTIYDGITRIGELTARQDEASRMVGGLRRDVGKMQAGQTARRPKVFLCLGHQAGTLAGIYTPGGGSFLDEVLRLAGGDNIFADAKDFPEVSKESIVSRQPDIIIDMAPRLDEKSPTAKQLIADWQRLGSMPATRQNRVYLMTNYPKSGSSKLPNLIDVL